MNHIKTYNKYVESIKYNLNSYDIMESLSIFKDKLIDTIDGIEMDFNSEFNYKLIDDKIDLYALVKDSTFLTKLYDKGYKVSNVENSKDFETFINKPIKFAFIRNENEIDLTEPKYLLLQYENSKINLYTISNQKKFYDMLSSKTIELESDGVKYIYSTSNSGNEWMLMNVGKENDIFKKYLRIDELRELLKSKNIKISII